MHIAEAGLPARLAFQTASAGVLGVGVAALVDAGLGVAPYDVLITGLAETASIAVGTSSIVCGLALTSLAASLGRRPRFGSLLTVVAVGISINASLLVLDTPASTTGQVVMATLGALATLVGITGTVVPEAGEGPIELLMIGLATRFDRSVGPARVVVEASCVAVGWVLGGEVGVVTVVYALVMGPLLHRTLGVFGR